MMTEEQRRFEQWVVGIYHTRLLKDEKGNYRGQVLHQLWQAWQAALTQPASPALNLPDGWVAVPVEPTEEMIIGFWGEIKHGQPERDAAKEAYADMLAATDAPHTAPIEPICATGGAEWVKCSERMPGECEPVIVVDHGIDVYPAVFSDGKFYEYGDTFTPCLMSNPTHWMPLPAAPEEK